MRYIESNLLPGEEVKYKAKISLFLFVQPLVLLLLGWLLYSVDADTADLPHYGDMFLLFLGTLSLVQRIMVKIGSAYAITNRRGILKTGIISRRAVELLLSKCGGLHIKQSIGGRIFNFGTITTSGAASSCPFIVAPLRFMREINTQID